MATVLFGAAIDEASATRLHTLGSRYSDDAGREYIYLLADEAITGAGYAVVIDQDFGTTMVDTTSTANARGKGVALPPIAVASGSYYWGQIYGAAYAGIRVAASAAAGARLNSTGTGGVVDDDGTAGAEELIGVHISAAAGGEAANVAGFITYPTVGATLA